LCSERGGREGNGGNSVDKRETEVRYLGSGRILFDTRYHPTGGAHGYVFFCSSVHSHALYILMTILQTSAHSSFLGPGVSFKFKETEKKKTDGSITVH
jgi:hypothetical protein